MTDAQPVAEEIKLVVDAEDHIWLQEELDRIASSSGISVR
jgi:hypothetical protein